MVKTSGSFDIVLRRKRRIDKGKHRKYYKNRPVKRKRKKQGVLVLYKSKRKRYDPVKAWIWERKKMSYDGYLRWNRKIRAKINPTVTYFVDKPFYVKPNEITTPEQIGDIVIERTQYAGTFLWMMLTHAKNSYRVSFKKKAVVVVIETEEGFHAKVYSYSKMGRYWFWKGE